MASGHPSALQGRSGTESIIFCMQLQKWLVKRLLGKHHLPSKEIFSYSKCDRGQPYTRGELETKQRRAHPQPDSHRAKLLNWLGLWKVVL